MVQQGYIDGPLDVVALAGSPVLIAMIATLQADDESGYQAQETDDKTNRRPIPVVQIHRGGQRDDADEQVEIRQAFVDWFGHPHIVSLLVSARIYFALPPCISPAIPCGLTCKRTQIPAARP